MGDPLEWTPAETPGWTARYGHASIVDELGIAYVIGGMDKEGPKNDVWKYESSIDLRNLESAYKATSAQAPGAPGGGLPGQESEESGDDDLEGNDEENGESADGVGAT